MFDEVGKLAWKAQLDVYGVAHVEEGATSDCPWRSAGQYADDETGLYYNRFRYYDPARGNYISQDPIHLDGGAELYGFVRDPLTWIDPLGLSGCGTKDDAAGETPRITSGSQVTEKIVRDAMKGASLQSQQTRGVSLPLVRQYVDKLLAGEAAPAIKIDGQLIVDGNHRYIAGRILGQEPPIQPWAGGRPANSVPWETIPINPESW